MKKIKIKINGKNYLLNAEEAVKNDLLQEVQDYPLKPGDVYAHPERLINSFLLVEVTYEKSSQKAGTNKYQLLGIGCRVNSGEFFDEVHTLEEIESYLIENKMVFEKNINSRISDLVG